MVGFLNAIKKLITESGEDWFEQHCYILLDALITKAHASPQFKQIELTDTSNVEDGRYLVRICHHDTILLKYKGKSVFVYSAPWGRQILTNANIAEVNEIFGQYCKVNSSGLFTLLKTSIAFSNGPLKRVSLFDEPQFKSAPRPKNQVGDFFSEVLGRPLTHLEKGLVDVIKTKMS